MNRLIFFLFSSQQVFRELKWVSSSPIPVKCGLIDRRQFGIFSDGVTIPLMWFHDNFLVYGGKKLYSYLVLVVGGTRFALLMTFVFSLTSQFLYCWARKYISVSCDYWIKFNKHSQILSLWLPTLDLLYRVIVNEFVRIKIQGVQSKLLVKQLLLFFILF